MKILVAGASGFLGGHMVARLLEQGHEVRAVSRRPLREWPRLHAGAENMQADLRTPFACKLAVRGMEAVYHFAAMIGGIGFLESHHAECTQSVVASSNLLEAAAAEGCSRFLFPSSACVYPPAAGPGVLLLEGDAVPYAPRGGYGWQKLFTEQMCGFYRQQYGLETRIARLGTVYGPHSPIGAAEKAPIAICRKVIEAIDSGSGEIEIWGDGEQVRSFLYVDDCIDALTALMAADYPSPVNIGSIEPASINWLVTMIEDIAGVRLARKYRPDAPQGVRARVCDVSLARNVCGWQERTSLHDGLSRTFEWVREQMTEAAVA